MQTIIALEYNNYYNRILKLEDSVSAYCEGRKYKTLDGISFNPNDGITTEYVINWDEDFTPNYLLILDSSNMIISRWFVIEASRTRAKQYKLSLKRDVLADYKYNLVNADVFVEKGCPEYDSPLLFNNENMSFNQIKTKELPLYDRTQCPWIVGYIAKNTGEVTVDVASDTTSEYVSIGTTMQTFASDFGLTLSGGNLKFSPYYEYIIGIHNGSFDVDYYINNVYKSWQVVIDTRHRALRSDSTIPDRVMSEELQTAMRQIGIGGMDNDTSTKLGVLTEDKYNQLLQYVGSTIRDTNGKFYKIKIVNTIPVDIQGTPITSADTSLFGKLSAAMSLVSYLDYKVPDDNSFGVVGKYQQASVIIEEVESLNAQVVIKNTRIATNDAQFDMFAIPYGYIQVFDSQGTLQCDTTPDVALATAIAIGRQLGTGCYDIQLLPYCPCQELANDGEIEYSDDNQISFVTDGQQNNKGVIVFCRKSNFEFNIPLHSPLRPLEKEEPNALDIKVSNQVELYRLCSPNYSGLFEFSIAKNRSVEYFNVDCTYKPYAPYIHVNPNFKNLYGADYNDVRGLICGGDFSFGMISDEFKQYEINHKNYRQIFDRSIQSMDVNNSITRQEAALGSVVGTVKGGVAGGVAGGMAGGPWGAVAGAVVGTVGGAVGGALDLRNLEARINDARSMSIDMFNYQLGNVKALPYSITKLSALTANNKLVPFLERYCCTGEEIRMLQDKIKFNGATIMAIGKLGDYMQEASDDNMTRFIQCQLIRVNDDVLNSEDTHLVADINAELAKGVYL